MIAPCPFCGSNKDNFCYCVNDGWYNCTHVEEDEDWSVQCGKCNAEGPWEHTQDEAILAWNTRVNYYPPAFDVEEYYKEDTDE